MCFSFPRVAGEELEIGITSCSTLKHVLPAGPAHARASAQHREGLPYISAQEGDKRPSRKVVCAGGSDLCRTNDPGSQVSPGPGCIYTLAALTQGSGYVTGSGRSSSCGYYGLQGHTGCQGEISCGPFLWGYLGCRVCVQYIFLFLGPITALRAQN